MTTPKKIADLAGWVIEQNGDLSCPLLKAIGYWHEDLGTVARTIDILEDLAPGSHRRPIAEVRLATRLMAIAAQADASAPTWVTSEMRSALWPVSALLS